LKSISANLYRGAEEDHGKHVKLAVPMAEIYTWDFLEIKKTHTLYYILFSSVGMAQGYWLEGRGPIPGRDNNFSSTPQRQDRI
jgi:hypothetical protein